MVERQPALPLRFAWRLAVSLVRQLGGTRYPIADLVGVAVGLAQPGRRRRAAIHHRRLDPSISGAEGRRRALRSYREYARTTVDFLWANALAPSEVRRCTEVVGLGHVEAATAAGRGAVLALTHFGNWDMAANVALAMGVPLSTVMAPIGPEWSTQLVVWARARNHLEIFTPDRAGRGLLRALRRGRFVALLSDVPAGGPTVAVPYCGGVVSFSTAPAWLAMRTGAALLPVDCRRGGPGYRIEVHAPIEPGEGDNQAAITSRLAASLEVPVRHHPDQWYPFGAVYVDGLASG